MEFSKVDTAAVLPSRATTGSVGHDVCCIEEFVLKPNEVTMVRTGLVMTRCPENTYIRIAPRSGLAAKHGVQVLAGVVDSDYRGEIKVLLFGPQEKRFEKGDRVAQLIVEQALTPTVRWSEPSLAVHGHDGVSVRGAGGFGSTGS